MIHIDTHVAIWLYLEETTRLTTRARALIEDNDVMASPMMKLELAYLFEVKRLVRTPSDVLTSLAAGIGLTMSTAPFDSVVAHAMTLTWTRDAFDRLIVANALADGAQLITTDRLVRANFAGSVWD